MKIESMRFRAFIWCGIMFALSGMMHAENTLESPSLSPIASRPQEDPDSLYSSNQLDVMENSEGILHSDYEISEGFDTFSSEAPELQIPLLDGTDASSYPDTVMSTTNLEGHVTAGNRMCSLPSGDYLYITDVVNDQVKVIRTSDMSLIKSISVGEGPSDICVTPNGILVYVSNYQSDEVTIIQTYNNTVLTTINVKDRPTGICVHPSGDYVYVSHRTGYAGISVIDTWTNAVVDTIDLCVGVDWDLPWDICITPSGDYLYTANYLDHSISVVRTSDNTCLEHISLGSLPPYAICAGPSSNYVYAVDHDPSWGDNVHVIRISDNTVVDVIAIDEGSHNDINFLATGRYIYVTSWDNGKLFVIDTNTNLVVETIEIETQLGHSCQPTSVCSHPSGEYIYSAGYPGELWVLEKTPEPSIPPVISHLAPSDQNITVYLNEMVNFQVSATDENADLSHFSFWYNWPDTFLGSQSTSGGYGTGNWNHTFNELGSHTFSAIIYDDDINWDMYTWNVTVEEPPSEPVLTQINPSSLTGNVITIGNQIDFEVNATDIDGDLRFYYWYYDGIFLANSFPENGYDDNEIFPYTFNELGTHEFTVVVEDYAWQTDTLTWIMDVEEEPSDPPVIEKITPTEDIITLTIGELVNFGVEATDINGDLLRFEWLYNGQVEEIDSVSGDYATDYWEYEFTELGAHLVAALIYDEDYNYDWTEWNINVEQVPVPPEITYTLPSATTIDVMEDHSVDFFVLAEDSNGDLAEFKWYIDSSVQDSTNASGSSDSDSWSPVFSDPGTFHITVRIFDSLGNQDNYSWDVIVEESFPPVVTPVYPTSQTVNIEVDDSINFQVDATDANGDLKEFRWYINSNYLVTHEASGGADSDNLPLTFYEDGSVDVMVIVYDDEGGNTAYTWTVNITYPPTAPNISRNNPSSSVEAVLVGSSINFIVNATDVNNNLDQFKWYLNGSLLATHGASGGSDSDNWPHTFNTDGTYTVKARIEDTDEFFDELTWTIHVEHEPTITRGSPSSGSVTIYEGESINFLANAHDSDGDLDQFKWYRNGSHQATHSASGTNDSDNWSYTFNSTGSYTIKARIEDTWEFNDDVNWYITVVIPPTPPVLTRINPVEDSISVMQWDELQFEVQATDVNNDLLEFQWYLDDSLVQTTPASGSPDNDMFPISFVDQGVFDIDCYIIDDASHQDSLSWNITVGQASGNELLSVTAPVSSDDWLHYQTNTIVTWEYPPVVSYDSIKVDIYTGGVCVATYADWTDNDGEFIRSDIIDPAWGSGSNFQLYVYDELGNYGWSENFSISTTEIIPVLLPDSLTGWTHFSSSNQVQWDDTGSLSSNLEIQLFKGAVLIEVLTDNTANDGDWIMTDSIPATYLPDTDYRIKLVDSYGDWGWSPYFSVEPSIGNEIISIIELDLTIWNHYEENTSVTWNHPGEIFYDTVSIDVYDQGTLIGQYTDWIVNDEEHIRLEGIHPSWGSGTQFRLKIYDNYDNYGWSSDFTIQPVEVIEITEPDSTTDWEHFTSNHPVYWNDADLLCSKVDIFLYKGQDLITTLATNTNNDGEWILSEMVPSDWLPATDYRIKIVDNYGDWGWSEYFEVTPSIGSEVITVTNPNSSSIWYQYDSGYLINWDYPAILSGTSVAIYIYHDGNPLDTLTTSTINDGSWTYSDMVPGTWIPDSTYQIQIIDDLGNYGWSDSFSVEPPSGVEIITVTHPTSSTEWSHEQTDTQVIWEYPTILSSDSVRVDIYKNGTLLDSYCSWTDNDGSYTRASAIPSLWGIGDDYQLKVYDTQDNYGWSDEFSINGTELIDVSEPDNTTTWMHFSTGHLVQWNNIPLESTIVSIALYKGGTFIDTLVNLTDNDGEWILDSTVPESWVPGSDYYIKITDDLGDWGYSDNFSIDVSTGSQIITVTEPGATTVWTHFETDLPINWEYPALLGLDGPLSGDSVSILLFNGAVFVDTLVSSTVNDNSCLYTGLVPMSWTPGNTYQVYIEDDLGNYGLGENFTIAPETGSAVITVIEPDSLTEWSHEQTGTQVIWEYPAILSGDSVRIDIYKNGTLLDSYCGWTDNDGSYTRTSAIPSLWGTGDDYQLKVYDTQDNYGWSDEFRIVGSDLIDVSEPDNTTTWMHFSSGHPVQWDNVPLGSTTVSIALYKGGTFIETLASSTGNDGEWILDSTVPASWVPGSDYYIKITDNLGDWGYSDNFSIDVSTSSEIINVIEPGATTVWTHFESDLPINWEYPTLLGLDGPLSGDSVSILLFDGAVFIDTLVSSTVNDNSYLYTDLVPMSWTPGNTYRVYIEDDLGNYGWGENFTIAPETGSAVITVIEPDSLTEWSHEQTGTQVIWEYPAILSGDSVRIDIYKNGTLLDSYCGWTDNDGSYTRTSAIPSLWGTGDDYQLKVYDTQDNYGWSDEFRIVGSDLIDVSEPDNTTTWMHFSSGHPVQWDNVPLGSTTVSIALYKGGTFVDTLVNLTDNDGEWMYEELVPMDWIIGSDYRIYIEDDLGDYGWSEYFTIEPESGAEIISVSVPNSSTTWVHYQSGTEAVWEYPAILSGESVKIDIYKDSVFLDTYADWTDNDGQFTQEGLVSAFWESGDNYELKIYDELGNYGWSEEFSIELSEAIEVSSPSADSVWMHFTTDHPVIWNIEYLQSTIVSLALFKDSTFVETLTSSTINDGEWIYDEIVPESWEPGSDYYIKISDNLGDWGYSDYFSVDVSSGAEIITVTEPGISTVWTHFETDLPISWEYPVLLGLDGLLSSDSVGILLFDNGVFVDTLVSSIPNNSTYLYTDPVSMSWTPGSAYQVYIEDESGNYGWSDYFTIESVSGSEVITVTNPASDSTWMHYQSGTEVVWEYPAILSGDSVKMDIYQGGVLLDNYCDWTANDGSYIRSEVIPSWWGIGANYQLKIYDNQENYGWSENFSLSGADVIEISSPSADSTWTHFTSGHPVNWDIEELLSTNVSIALYKDTSLVETLVNPTINDGEWILNELVSYSWGYGSDYRVKIVDNYGDWGWSEYFTVDPVSGSEIITITEPEASTVWTHFESDLPINWEYPALLGLDGPLSGDSVSILLFNGAVFVDTLLSSTVNNGSCLYTDLVPMSWTPGNTYQVYIEDDLGNYGWGENFTIEPETGSAVITVIQPDSFTEWSHEQTGTQVIWEYPAILSGDSVRIDIYESGVLLDSYCGWTVNDGHYIRSEAIPSLWDIGDNYQLKVYDEHDNYGWSDSFNIIGSELIDVTEPESSTVWTHFESGYPVSWQNPSLHGREAPLAGDSVSIALYDGDDFVELLCISTLNDGEWILDEPVSYAWGYGADFRIKIIDTYGDFGWSDYFTVEAVSGSEVISFTTPTSGTTWMHYQSDTEAVWEYPALLSSDSVRIDIYQGSVLLDTYTDWTENDGEYTRTEIIPIEWGVGNDYQLYIQDGLGNFGWSENFEISVSSGADIIEVIEPVYSTIWEHFTTDHPVNWEYPSILGLDGPLSGDSVSIALYQDGTFVDTLVSSTFNDGAWLFLEMIPMSWIPGNDYRIYIQDNLNNYGWSEYFTVEPETGSEIIEISEPDSSTIWTHFECDIPIVWEYPADNRFGLDEPVSGDSVIIILYNDTTLIETLVSSTPNNGSFVFDGPVPMEWAAGSDYRLLIRDNLDNYGWSGCFTVEVCTGSEVISVTEPNASSEWTNSQTDRPIVWEYPALPRILRPLSGDSVSIELYKDDSFVSILIASTPNSGSWMFTDSIPESWISDDDYRINITDNLSNFGWSEYFSIDHTQSTQSGDGILAFRLHPIVPNPSNNSFTVTYAVPYTSAIDVALYNIVGRIVMIIAEGEHNEGIYNAQISDLPSGLYICQMRIGSFIATEQIVVIRN